MSGPATILELTEIPGDIDDRFVSSAKVVLKEVATAKTVTRQSMTADNAFPFLLVASYDTV